MWLNLITLVVAVAKKGSMIEIKKKIYKLFLTLMVCLSLNSNPIALEEIRKILETLSGTAQVQELDEEEAETEEIRKKK